MKKGKIRGYRLFACMIFGKIEKNATGKRQGKWRKNPA